MPKYYVTHVTKYQYPSAVTDSANQIILYPKSDANQQIISQLITTKPHVQIDTFSDYFDNQVGFFTVIEPHQELEIRVDLEVITTNVPMRKQTLSMQEQKKELERIQWAYPFMEFLQLEQVNAKSEIQDVFDVLNVEYLDTSDVVSSLSNYIYNEFAYRQGVTTVETTVDEIWSLKAGVCQDFAHLLITMLRMLHIPCRYISGYICPSKSEMRGEGATHAWVEVYIPGLDWVGIDPTNNCWVADRHIIIAYGRDFKDCTPVKGTYKGPSEQRLTVSVVISNEQNKYREGSNDTLVPMYSTTAAPSVSTTQNSYRHFLDMQQQQQQQQQ
jgi:transglutaminase-like putative cysteine protease